MSESEFPSFITKEFCQNILNKFEGQEKKPKLVDYSIDHGTKKGDNFASCILRVKLVYKSNEDDLLNNVNFIIKAKPKTSVIAEYLDKFDTFQNEAFVYQQILKKCIELDPTTKIAPKLIYVDDNAMVLEDLNHLNFKLADRKKRLNFDETKIVLKTLAKLHALTAVSASDDEKLMKNHLTSCYNSKDENPMSFFFVVSLMETIETLKNVPELQNYIEFLSNYDIVEKECQVFTRGSTEKFHVFNHADMWLNNILFKYDDTGKNAIEATLVDYQECFYGSCGIDLNHFLYTSCDIEVLKTQTDDLIRFYHEDLSSSLRKLNYKNIPSLADIHHEFEMKCDQALIVLCAIVPVMNIENSEHANVENFLTDTEEAAKIRRIIWTNPKFIEILKVLFPLLKKRNMFL